MGVTLIPIFTLTFKNSQKNFTSYEKIYSRISTSMFCFD